MGNALRRYDQVMSNAINWHPVATREALQLLIHLAHALRLRSEDSPPALAILSG